MNQTHSFFADPILLTARLYFADRTEMTADFIEHQLQDNLMQSGPIQCSDDVVGAAVD